MSSLFPSGERPLERFVPSIPSDVRDLLIKLGFIAEIQEGDKPNVSDMTMVAKSSWRGALYRWIRGENRTSMIMHLESTVEQSRKIVENYGASSPHIVELVQSYLKKARQGIVNLERTYSDAPSIKIRLQVLHSTINLQVLALETMRTPLSRALEQKICDMRSEFEEVSMADMLLGTSSNSTSSSSSSHFAGLEMDVIPRAEVAEDSSGNSMELDT